MNDPQTPMGGFRGGFPAELAVRNEKSGGGSAI